MLTYLILAKLQKDNKKTQRVLTLRFFTFATTRWKLIEYELAK